MCALCVHGLVSSWCVFGVCDLCVVFVTCVCLVCARSYGCALCVYGVCDLCVRGV